MDLEYTLLVKNFNEEINNLMKNGLETQLTKKRPNVFATEI